MNKLFRTVIESDEGKRQNLVPLSAPTRISKIFVKDMEVMMSIGVHENEKNKKQKVIVNVEALVRPNKNWKRDDIKDVVSYTDIVEHIQDLTESDHIYLVETLAERIGEYCLQDHRVQEIKVRIEKPEVYSFVQSVGTELIRKR